MTQPRVSVSDLWPPPSKAAALYQPTANTRQSSALPLVPAVLLAMSRLLPQLGTDAATVSKLGTPSSTTASGTGRGRPGDPRRLIGSRGGHRQRPSVIAPAAAVDPSTSTSSWSGIVGLLPVYEGHLGEASPRELSNLALALGRLGLDPGPQFMGTFLLAATRKLHLMSPRVGAYSYDGDGDCARALVCVCVYLCLSMHVYVCGGLNFKDQHNAAPVRTRSPHTLNSRVLRDRPHV